MTSSQMLPSAMLALCAACILAACPNAPTEAPTANEPTTQAPVDDQGTEGDEPAWLAQVKDELRSNHSVDDEGDTCRRDADCDSPLRCSAEGICDWPIAMTGYQDDTTPFVVIDTGGEEHRYFVEIADTGAEQQRGLMDRRILQPGFGMVFVFSRDAPRSFWMRNCHIYLDMIYVTSGGVIDSIARNAVPESDRAHFRESTNSYPSDGPARFVIEVPGGDTERLGIERGDRVSFENFPAGLL